MVFSDDWLFPRCLEEMVALAEADPSVGIVGSFASTFMIRGLWAGPSYPSHCVDGRDFGRWLLLEEFWGGDGTWYGSRAALSL